MTKIIVVEKSEKHMKAMFDMFMDLLDTSVDISYCHRSEARITTGTHEILFFFKRDGNSLRGYKADIVINNTDNEEITEWAEYSGTIYSKYLR